MKTTTRLLCLAAVSITFATAPAVAAEPNDDAALAGLKSAKAVYDFSVGDKRQLLLYLNVMKDARDRMIARGVKPDVVVVFRGAAVTLLGKAAPGAAPEQQQLANDVLALVSSLKAEGVKFEACSYAMKLLKVDAASMPKDIHVVGNTFNSVIAYQNRGYALVNVI